MRISWLNVGHELRLQTRCRERLLTAGAQLGVAMPHDLVRAQPENALERRGDAHEVPVGINDRHHVWRDRKELIDGGPHRRQFAFRPPIVTEDRAGDRDHAPHVEDNDRVRVDFSRATTRSGIRCATGGGVARRRSSGPAQSLCHLPQFIGTSAGRLEAGGPVATCSQRDLVAL